MAPETTLVKPSRAPMTRATAGMIAVAAYVAIGIGVSFGNILFGLPALNRLQEQALELGVLLVPTVAGMTIMVTLAAAHRIPVLVRANGYLTVSVGALLGTCAYVLLENRVGGQDATGVWVVVAAAGGGMALAGLTLNAAGAPPHERFAIAVGLTLGIAFNGHTMDWALRHGFRLFAISALTAAIALLGCMAARERTAPTVRVPKGAIFTVAFAGAVVMVGLVTRGIVLGEFRPGVSFSAGAGAARYGMLAVAVIAALALIWSAYRLGGRGDARWPAVGFGIAAPITPVALGFSSIAEGTQPIVVMAIIFVAIIGATVHWSRGKRMPWEALGVLAAAVGLMFIAGAGDKHLFYLLIATGSAFALATGLAWATASPAGGPGVGLGLAALMLTAQALGPLTLDSLGINQIRPDTWPTAVPSAISAVALVVLFGLSRAGRGTE